MRSQELSSSYRIIVRGGGDIATGAIHRLFMAGFRPLVLDTSHPSSIRRKVSMCEAIYDGCVTVEGVTARLARDLGEACDIIRADEVPVMVDEEGKAVCEYRPDALVDAILAKNNLGSTRDMAPLVIALGPGFEAGVDCDYVIETMRGHNLARVYSEGRALPNTGVPGIIAGVGKERVIYSPASGIMKNIAEIGDFVNKGDPIAFVTPEGGGDPIPVPASITGLVRGIIRDGYNVTEGLKISDIDPRPGEYANCFTISDKARSIGGSVLELICRDMISGL